MSFAEEESQPLGILRILEEYRRNNQFVDVTLSNGRTFWKAHKLILSSRSDILKDFFLENPCEKAFIYFYGINDDTINILMNYIYNDDSTGRDGNDQIGKLASDLGISGLKKITRPPSGRGKFLSPPPPLPLRYRHKQNITPEKRPETAQKLDLCMTPEEDNPIDYSREQLRRLNSDSSEQRRNKETKTKSQRHRAPISTYGSYTQDVSFSSGVSLTAQQYADFSETSKIDESYIEETEGESTEAFSTTSDHHISNLSPKEIVKAPTLSQAVELDLSRPKNSTRSFSKHSESFKKDKIEISSKKRSSETYSSKNSGSSKDDVNKDGFNSKKRCLEKHSSKRSEPSEKDLEEAGPSHSRQSIQSASPKQDSSLTAQKKYITGEDHFEI